MMPHMKVILRLIDICLFRSGPDSLPANNQLMQLLLLIYFIVSVSVNQIDMSFRISLWIGLTDVIVLTTLLYGLLRLNHFLPRYQQSLMALAGTGSLLGLLAMPLLWAFHQYAEQSDTANFILFALMLVMLWSLMVTAHIIRRSIETSAPKAVALTVLYVVMAIVINGLVMSGVA